MGREDLLRRRNYDWLFPDRKLTGWITKMRSRQQAYFYICETLKRDKEICSYFSTSPKEIYDSHWIIYWHKKPEKNLTKPDIRTYIKMIFIFGHRYAHGRQLSQDRNIQFPPSDSLERSWFWRTGMWGWLWRKSNYYVRGVRPEGVPVPPLLFLEKRMSGPAANNNFYAGEFADSPPVMDIPAEFVVPAAYLHLTHRNM